MPPATPKHGARSNGLDQTQPSVEFDGPEGSTQPPAESMQPPTATNERTAGTSSEPIESEFLFEELAGHETMSPFGIRHATETLEIELGMANMTPGEAQQLQGGAVVALDQAVDDPIMIRHRDRVVATGKMTVVNGKIAVRICERMD